MISDMTLELTARAIPFTHIGDVLLINADSRDIWPIVRPAVSSIITDPPYGMDYRPRHKKHAKIQGDTDATLLNWAVSLPAPHAKYIFGRWDNIRDIPLPKSLVTWIKNNWSMGDLRHAHARQTECIFFYPGESHHFPSGRPRDVIYAARSGNKLHPTQKPVELMLEILGWTAGLVFDPFLGSGATGVACVRAGRPFIGCEINAEYFQVASTQVLDELLMVPRD